MIRDISELDPSEVPDELPDRQIRSESVEYVGFERITTYQFEYGNTGIGLRVVQRADVSPARYVSVWPLSASEPTGGPQPPAAALDIAPGLDVVLGSAPEKSPYSSLRRGDWPVDATLKELWIREDQWSNDDSARVEQVVTPDVDAYVRALIDDWAGLWVQLARFGSFRHRFPRFIAALEELHRTDPRYLGMDGKYRDKWVDRALSAGLWSTYRTRHPWPDPIAQDCVVCGRTFPPESLWGYQWKYGPPIACSSCLWYARFGHQLNGLPIATLLDNLSQVLGFPPPSSFHSSYDLVALSDDRAAVLTLLVALPDSMTCSRSLGVEVKGPGRWLATLQAAGVVGEAWRMQRGVMTLADDGHLCRSMGELTVERYLIAHGIEHDIEPSYPVHASLNPDGRKRADWLLQGDVWVEYAGMMEDDAYAKKMRGKVELAQEVGLKLLVLTPTDLMRLGDVLASAGVR